MNPSHIGQMRQLAMILRSRHPQTRKYRPGPQLHRYAFRTVPRKRCGVYPILRKRRARIPGVGGLIHRSVSESGKWQSGGIPFWSIYFAHSGS